MTQGLPGYIQSNGTEEGWGHLLSTGGMALGNFPKHSGPQLPVPGMGIMFLHCGFVVHYMG